jgi:hypothetical protein
MWAPQLEQYEKPDGSIQLIGWILVNEAGEHYMTTEHGRAATVTGFTRKEMQGLADELNAGDEAVGSPTPRD